MRVLRRNKEGFTLVELMVAMLIMLVGLVGLLKAVEVSTEYNLRNQLRDEATLIADRTMGDLKVKPFANLSGYLRPKAPPASLKSQLRGGNFSYTVFKNVTCVTQGSGAATGPGSAAKMTVTVSWSYKGTPSSYSVTSLRSN